ncbi:Site-specific recombinase XerD [Saccharopolyspora shandongensis]|uniref:Site-specific recombinase XerD n=1 Tax=Saccharopolyspora shandongensis TaxID=418495 RepID=A0A1H3CFH7_9PSEU|nr:site-specific integrase [Saccharopolyspora shandongensis]SDX52907.1 Site-specific recombinase XerD [Saccharopolyspora shandongensis]
MAWSEKRPNGRYRGAYRDRGGTIRYVRGTFSQPAEAKREAHEAENSQRRPGAINLDGARMPWGSWVDQWLGDWTAEPSTRARAVSCIEQHIRPHWGAVPLDEIESDAIKSWVKLLRKTQAKGTKKGEEPKLLAPRTINKIVTTFGTTLRGAVDRRLLAVSPSAGIKLETVTADDEYFMTRAEVARFREVAAEDSEQIDLLIDIGTETGLRWGELAGLHLERVDTKRLVIQVQEVWDKHSNEIKPYPKGRRRRGVPITRRLAGRIDDYVERNQPKRCRARHRGGGRCTGALLLASKVGTPLNYGNVRRRHWDSVAERAGLAGVTPHDMRHAYASWLIQDGAGVEMVSALLGHKSWTDHHALRAPGGCPLGTGARHHRRPGTDSG